MSDGAAGVEPPPMARTLRRPDRDVPDDPAGRRGQARLDLARGAPGGRGTGVTKWMVATLVLGLVTVVVLAQNTGRTRLNLLWGGIDAPLFAILLLVGLGFAVLTELGSLLWRHRRRTRPAPERRG